MNHEAVLLESRTMRGTLVGRTEALDKVKALRLLPDGVHVTTRMVADYFGVHEEAVNSVVRRHREELRESGMALLKGADLQDFLVVNMTTRKSCRSAPLRRAIPLSRSSSRWRRTTLFTASSWTPK
ncbi:hypothetical protein FB465_3720 [Kitasatospora atroaurantiaca]|uniref:Uncharacterized protein n=1 Tax=Kitasatospora atroaurantiaca TaxID=285545 RepID=A0A561ESQ5_9ACTN|nr:hypothetical protein [Kitasatospora atroaurantiaca]TWE18636.1 hypothetical protein FB465_3720 [Kitasatospora atroaurantiaca]